MPAKVCPNCQIELRRLPFSYGLIRVIPPDDVRIDVPPDKRTEFSPVVAFGCRKCAMICLYAAMNIDPEPWQGTTDLYQAGMQTEPLLHLLLRRQVRTWVSVCE